MASRKVLKKARRYFQVIEREIGVILNEEIPSLWVAIWGMGIGNGFDKATIFNYCLPTPVQIRVFIDQCFVLAEFGKLREVVEFKRKFHGTVYKEQTIFVAFLEQASVVPYEDQRVLKPFFSSVPKGLGMIPYFVDEKLEAKILELLYRNSLNDEPNDQGEKRTTRHFGYEIRDVTNDVDINEPLNRGIPDYLEPIMARIKQYRIYNDELPDQLTVTQYAPGEGMDLHYETHSSFEGPIVYLGFGSDFVMNFAHGGTFTSIIMPPRSLITLRDSLRLCWTHGISSKKSEIVPDFFLGGLTILNRKPFVLLTFRKIRRGEGVGCQCKCVPVYKELCDSQSGSVSKLEACEQSSPIPKDEYSTLEEKYNTFLEKFQTLKETLGISGKESMPLEQESNVCVEDLKNREELRTLEETLEIPGKEAMPLEKGEDLEISDEVFKTLQQKLEIPKNESMPSEQESNVFVDDFKNREEEFKTPEQKLEIPGNESMPSEQESDLFVEDLKIREEEINISEPESNVCVEGPPEEKSAISEEEAWESGYQHCMEDYNKTIAARFHHIPPRPIPQLETFVKNLDSGFMLLDVGCDNGRRFGINKDIIRIGYDITCNDAVTMNSPRQDSECLKGSALHFPFQDNSFDAVIAEYLIPTKEGRIRFMSEIVRVMKHGAFAVIYLWPEDPAAHIYSQVECEYREGDYPECDLINTQVIPASYKTPRIRTSVFQCLLNGELEYEHPRPENWAIVNYDWHNKWAMTIQKSYYY